MGVKKSENFHLYICNYLTKFIDALYQIQEIVSQKKLFLVLNQKKKKLFLVLIHCIEKFDESCVPSSCISINFTIVPISASR